MYNGRDYFSNRKAVLDLKKEFAKNMVSLTELKKFGITTSQIKQWEKEGKIISSKVKNKNYYNFDVIRKLAFGSNI